MITPVYAAIFAFIFIGLSVKTLLTRRRLRIGVGDNNNKQLLRAIRAHGNFSEYTPFALLLIFMAESQTIHALWLHGLCLTLLIGRISHAYGISNTQENFFFRVFGMSMTFAAMGFAALCLLFIV